MTSEATRVETVVLPSGAQLKVEVRDQSGYQDVGALDALRFEAVASTLEELGRCLDTAITRMKPTKAAIEFGLEVGVESGQLTTLVCKGKTTANFAVKLEWDHSK